MPGKAGARKTSKRVFWGRRAIKTAREGKDSNPNPSKHFTRSHLAPEHMQILGNACENPTRHWINIEVLPKTLRASVNHSSGHKGQGNTCECIVLAPQGTRKQKGSMTMCANAWNRLRLHKKGCGEQANVWEQRFPLVVWPSTRKRGL